MGFLHGNAWRWMLVLAIVFVMGWLWMSWRNSWFPFGVQGAATQQSALDSLTAPESTTSSPSNALKQLTPASVATSSAASAASNNISNNASILDSLTPKK